jgi:hypothetical protein
LNFSNLVNPNKKAVNPNKKAVNPNIRVVNPNKIINNLGNPKRLFDFFGVNQI